MSKKSIFFFVLFFFITLSFFSSDVSFTITGIIPEVKLLQPKSIFFSQNIELENIYKKNTKIFPPKTTYTKTFSSNGYSDTLEFSKKNMFTIKADSVYKEFEVELNTDFIVHENIEFSYKEYFVVNTEFKANVLSALINPRSVFKIEKTISLLLKKRIKKYPYPITDLSSFEEETFSFKKTDLKIINKKEISSKNRLEFGIGNDYSYEISFRNEAFLLKKNYQDNYIINFKLGNSSIYSEIGNDYFNTGMKSEDTETDFCLNNGLFTSTIKKTGFLNENLILGVNTFDSILLPVIGWNWFDYALFSISLEKFGEFSYGPSIIFHQHPYSFNIALGMDMEKFIFGFDSLLSVNLDKFNSSIKFNAGYLENYFFNVSLDNHSLYFNDINIDISGNIGYNEALFLGLGSRIVLSNFDIHFKLDYINGGLLFNVTTGIEF